MFFRVILQWKLLAQQLSNFILLVHYTWFPGEMKESDIEDDVLYLQDGNCKSDARDIVEYIVAFCLSTLAFRV